MGRRNWFEIALSLVFLSGILYAAFSDAYNLPNRWFIRDDAYYYYKVAQNVSEGLGSTFDGVHPTNGYHPLWLLICIPIFALARFDLILPLRILAIVTGLLQLGTSVLLYRLLRQAVSEAAGIVAACFWAFNTYVLLFLYKTGVESGITIFLVLLLQYALYRFELTWRTRKPSLGQIAALGVLSILITFGRLDLVFFSLVAGLWIVFRGSPLRYLLPLDILALVIAAVTAFIARLGFTAYYEVADSAMILIGASLVCKLPALYLLRAYSPPSTWRAARLVPALAVATASGSALMAAILLGGGALGILPKFSLIVLLLDLLISFGLLLVIRAGAFTFRTPETAHDSTSPVSELKGRWKTWTREGAVFYGIVGGSLGLYMLWSRLAFGTFTPVSGQIKQWWGSFAHSIYGTAASSWLTFFALNPFSDFNAWAPTTTWLSDWSNKLLYHDGGGFGNPRWQGTFIWIVLLAAIAVLMIALLRRKLAVQAAVKTAMIPLFVGAWLQILAYNVPGYASPKEWYWLLQPLILVISGAFVVGTVSRLLIARGRIAQIALWGAVAWFGVTGAVGYWRDAYALNPYGQHPADTAYSPIIPFLEANTPPGAMIGMTGGGNVGYLMRGRTIVNMDGLINSPEYFKALQAGTGADYLYDSGLRYVFANPTLLDSNPYRSQFSDRLELVVEWGGKDLLKLLPAPST